MRNWVAAAAAAFTRLFNTNDAFIVVVWNRKAEFHKCRHYYYRTLGNIPPRTDASIGSKAPIK